MRPAFLIVVFSAFASAAGAQLQTLAIGTRVRVDAPAYTRETVQGTVMAQTADSVTLALNNAAKIQLPSAAVTRVRASLGRTAGAGARKGAKIGAGIGVGLGALAGLVLASGSSDDEFIDCTDACPLFAGAAVGVFYGGVFALVGAGVGALTGAEGWTTVYARPVRVSLGTTGTGAAALGLSVRF